MSEVKKGVYMLGHTSNHGNILERQQDSRLTFLTLIFIFAFMLFFMLLLPLPFVLFPMFIRLLFMLLPTLFPHPIYLSLLEGSTCRPIWTAWPNSRENFLWWRTRRSRGAKWGGGFGRRSSREVVGACVPTKMGGQQWIHIGRSPL